MPTFTTTQLAVQPGIGATQETYNNHRKLFVDSAGRYWYCGWTQDTGEAVSSVAVSIDVYWATDPTGVWTKETIATDADFGLATGSDLNACFAEAINGDIVVAVSLSGNDPDWELNSERLHVFRRTGTDASPAWAEQAQPLAAFTSSSGSLWATNYAIFNHPDDSDVWIIIHADKDPGDTNPTDLSYMLSTDNMATWAAPVILKAGTGNGDAIAERNGLCVATGDENRTLYLIWVDSRAASDTLAFARLTSWDTAPTLSTVQDIEGGSTSQPHGAIAAAWRSDGSLDVFYNQYNGSFLNYIIRHRNLSGVDDPTLTISGETSLDNTQYQRSGPFGAYLNQDNEYQYYWNSSAEAGREVIEGASTEVIVSGSQTTEGLSMACNHALDKDFAAATTYGQLLRGTFLVTYGLHTNGINQAYSIVVADTTELAAPVTTLAPTTPAPTTPTTTLAATSPPPSTTAVTGAPTTATPTTPVPTTVGPTITPSDLPMIQCARTFKYATRELRVRAWIASETGAWDDSPLDHLRCTATLIYEDGDTIEVAGLEDPFDPSIVMFRVPRVLPIPSHAYILRVHLTLADGTSMGQRDFPLGTT